MGVVPSHSSTMCLPILSTAATIRALPDLSPSEWKTPHRFAFYSPQTAPTPRIRPCNWSFPPGFVLLASLDNNLDRGRSVGYVLRQDNLLWVVFRGSKDIPAPVSQRGRPRSQGFFGRVPHLCRLFGHHTSEARRRRHHLALDGPRCPSTMLSRDIPTAMRTRSAVPVSGTVRLRMP